MWVVFLRYSRLCGIYHIFFAKPRLLDFGIVCYHSRPPWGFCVSFAHTHDRICRLIHPSNLSRLDLVSDRIRILAECVDSSCTITSIGCIAQLGTFTNVLTIAKSIHLSRFAPVLASRLSSTSHCLSSFYCRLPLCLLAVA